MNITARKVLLLVFFIAVCGYADKPRFDNEVPDKFDNEVSDKKTDDNKVSENKSTEGMKLGARAGFSLYKYSPEMTTIESDLEIYGYGFGAGLVVNVPLTSTLNFVPEVGFLYRKQRFGHVVDQEYSIFNGMTASLSEYAISIPAMLRYTPAKGTRFAMPFYLAVGVQIDIPIQFEIIGEESGLPIYTPDDVRAYFDFGIPLGLGYFITPNLEIDLRAVISLTSTGLTSITFPYDEIKDSWNHYGAGLTYYF